MNLSSPVSAVWSVFLESLFPLVPRLSHLQPRHVASSLLPPPLVHSLSFCRRPRTATRPRHLPSRPRAQPARRRSRRALYQALTALDTQAQDHSLVNAHRRALDTLMQDSDAQLALRAFNRVRGRPRWWAVALSPARLGV